MNITQLSEQLKDVPQGTLVGYAKNPNSVVPQFLALAEIQRRQQLQAPAQAPTGTVAEDVLAQAAPQQMAPQQVDPRMMQAMQQAQQLPENQPGVTQLPSGMPQGMAAGGIVAFAGGGGLSLDDDEEDDREMARLFPQRSSGSRFDQLLEALPSSVAGGIRGLADKGTQAVQSVREAVPQSFQAVRSAMPQSFDQAKAASSARPDAQETDVEGFLSKIQHLESRGRHFDSKGNILTSPKGAEGIMQVMRKTQKDPGYGVTPARDRSPEELKRVGDEYGIAMLREFRDPRIAAMAYNWGPGNVKKWLASDKTLPIPKETQKYISHFAQGGIASFAKGDQVEDDSPTSTLESLFSFLKQTPEQATFAKNYLEDAQRKRAAQEALTAPELDVPFYKAIRPSERKAVEEKRAEILRSPVPQSVLKAPEKKPETTADEVMRLANVNAVNHAQKKEGLDYSKVVPQYGNATDQEFRDFDQAAALYQAENQPKVVAEPTVPAAPSEAQMYAKELRDMIKQQAAEVAQNKKMQLGLSLLGAAGSGLKSGSRYLGQGLGDTLTGGVSTYGALKKQEQDQAKDIMAAQLGMYKYGSAAEETAKNRALEKEYKDLALSQRERIEEANRGVRMSEISQRQVLAARDDLRQYEQVKLKALQDRFPIPMPKDPNYQAALQSIYNDPVYKQLFALSGYTQPTTQTQTAPAGNRPPIGSFQTK